MGIQSGIPDTSGLPLFQHKYPMKIQGRTEFTPDVGPACYSCGTRTDAEGICELCGADFDEDIVNSEQRCEALKIDDISDKVDAIVKEEGFSVTIGSNVFSKVKVGTEKGLARIRFSFSGKRMSVLVNPNLDRKIIQKTGIYLSGDQYMSVVNFVNYICFNKNKYGLERYKAFQ